MSAKKRKRAGQPAPVWRAFMQAAWTRMTGQNMNPENASNDWVELVAAEIVRGGDAEKFLKAVRRGRSTARQSLRYRLLREVEKLAGDTVKRRRVDSNTPDAVALKRAPQILILCEEERPAVKRTGRTKGKSAKAVETDELFPGFP